MTSATANSHFQLGWHWCFARSFRRRHEPRWQTTNQQLRETISFAQLQLQLYHSEQAQSTEELKLVVRKVTDHVAGSGSESRWKQTQQLE
jgi:hypothetical protein